MANIREQTSDYIIKARSYCETRDCCEGCFFNIDKGDMGNECRIQILEEGF